MKSIERYWKAFLQKNPAYTGFTQPSSYYFCDNEKDADACAALVVQKVKQATSSSLWWFKKHQEKLPEVGDLAIVTNWAGIPQAIETTTKVEIVKFKDITSAYAFIEGEGDKSLAYWKAVHWAYYTNEMKPHGEKPDENMEIVCEYFETIG